MFKSLEHVWLDRTREETLRVGQTDLRPIYIGIGLGLKAVVFDLNLVTTIL